MSRWSYPNSEKRRVVLLQGDVGSLRTAGSRSMYACMQSLFADVCSVSMYYDALCMPFMYVMYVCSASGCQRGEGPGTELS